MKKKQERLAALAKERGDASDNDNGEAVVVCKRRLYSQQFGPASQVEEDIDMENHDASNSSGQAAGADGGANDAMQFKGQSNVVALPKDFVRC